MLKARVQDTAASPISKFALAAFQWVEDADRDSNRDHAFRYPLLIQQDMACALRLPHPASSPCTFLVRHAAGPDFASPHSQLL